MLPLTRLSKASGELSSVGDVWGSSVSVVTRLRIGRPEQGILFATASRPALGPTKWVPGSISQDVKWPGREAAYSPLSSAEVKHTCNYTSTPPIRLHKIVLNYAQWQVLP